MSQRRDILGNGPVGDGILPQYNLLRERVELETSLQTIASVEEGVRVTGTESDQTGGQQLILTLQNGNRKTKCRCLMHNKLIKYYEPSRVNFLQYSKIFWCFVCVCKVHMYALYVYMYVCT